MLVETVSLNVLDPLEAFPEEPRCATPVFEFKEYKQPFELWDPAEYQEPDGVYQPIHFALNLTEEQHAILLATQAAFSQELIDSCHAYLQFY